MLVLVGKMRCMVMSVRMGTLCKIMKTAKKTLTLILMPNGGSPFLTILLCTTWHW